MTYNITKVSALEILDSRSRPTLEVTVELRGGVRATAGVPSGASTGSKEAVELRDGGEAFGGAGVTKARANVEGEIRHLLTTRSFDSQEELDRELIDLDGTDNKSRLGSNAILGTSMAFARAAATSESKELWQWLDGVPGQEHRLPVPCLNVLNGGEHAANPLEFQEFMICPLGAKGMRHAVRAGSEIYAKLRSLLVAKGETVGLGDEGGFAPNIATPEEALQLLTTAITEAGYSTGVDGVMIALDPAASEFYSDGAYHVGGEKLSSTDMINRYEQMVADFPIWSIEDGVAEDDDEGWKAMTTAMGEKIQLVGDDNFCTNPKIIARAIDHGIANASLIKLNQIGTVTETLAAMRLCQQAGYGQMISHRSGETPDPFIADFAVATGAGQMKSGAPARGERIAKYNRLLEIARHGLPYGLA
ncbi:MAG: phosphopyruvate hydratase [Flaviflexus sp.]|nr:phosphopyruvate hydratase [Flaviflexus sp.]